MSEDKYNEGNEIDPNITKNSNDSIIEKKIIDDTHFDAFPTFLHISVPDSSPHHTKSSGIDMIMSELAELEASLPPDPDKDNEETVESDSASLPVKETDFDAEKGESEPEISADLNSVLTQELPSLTADKTVISEDLAKDDEAVNEISDTEEDFSEQPIVDETETPEESDTMKEPRTDRISEEIYLNIPPSSQQTPKLDNKNTPFTVNINYDVEDGNETVEASKPQKGFKKMLGKVFPKKGDGIGESIRKIILFIAVLTMIVCSVILLNIYVVSPYVNSLRAKEYAALKTTTFVNESKNINDEYPGVIFPVGMQPEYASSYARNKDFVGWLEIPAIGIDMPIVQSKNNKDYLKKNFDGKKDKFGCCFVDYNNNIAKLDQNTVIYGHNTRNGFGTMFVPLEKLRTIDGFKTAPLIEFNTIYSNYKWKVYAVFITNGSKSGDNDYVFNYVFKNLNGDELFKTYIKQLDQRKLYTTGVDLLPNDKLLTLSTCTYDFDNGRLVVVARMLRVGESEDVNTSDAVLNSNPRYPQAWYSAKGQSNPFRNAEKWFAN